jgi:O-antigen/teichoic acid export membrane protein
VIYAAGSGLIILFGFLQTLIIPKYLTVADYGYWQLFTLYVSYVGILPLGFLDGILVRWAGKDIGLISSDIKPALKFLVLQQVAFIIPLGLIIYFLLQPPFQWIGLMICIFALILNLSVFFMFTAQATRQFRLLTILNIGRGFVFIALIALLFVSGYLEYQYVIIMVLTSYLLFLFALIAYYNRYLRRKTIQPTSLYSFGKTNIDVGIFILLGNMIFIIFCTLDRLMVSAFFTIEQFAVYTFALTITQIALLITRAVADVVFSHFSAAAPEQRTSAYQLGKRALIFCWAFFLGAYFPLAVLIEFYLPQYISSLPIIRILLGTVGLSSLVFILQVNYYRLYGKQRQYFIIGIIALVLAALLGLMAIIVIGTLESVAIAMLVSFLIWYVSNGLSLKDVTGESSGKMAQDLMIMGCYFAGMWISLFLTDQIIIQTLLYIGFFLIISICFSRDDIKEMLFIVRKSRSKLG